MFLRDDNRAAAGVTAEPKQASMRTSKTFQDSNIFGYKDTNSVTVAENVKADVQRPYTAHKKVIPQESHMNDIFTRDDKNARQKLKKLNDSEFRPTFENADPTQKHMNEFYGERHSQTYNRPQTAAPKSTANQPKSASEMKFAQQQSGIFPSQTNSSMAQPPCSDLNREKLMPASIMWNSSGTFQKPNNIESTDADQGKSFAQTKKQMEMQSDIFGSHQPIDGPRHSEKPKSRLNEDANKPQNLFSDLFGHDDKDYNYRNPQNIVKMDPLIPTNLPWSDARTEKYAPMTHDEHSANERKLAHLSSSVMNNDQKHHNAHPVQEPPLSQRALEKEMIPEMTHHQKKNLEMKSEIPFAGGNQNWAARKSSNQEECATYDFDLKSIPKNMDYDALKKAFSGYHVVDLKADRNQVSGSALGTGRIQIRANNAHDILKLKHDLKEHGILMLSHYEKHNRKNNYRDIAKLSWHDQYLQSEEGRIKSDFKTAAESKLKNLESEGEVFGSSKGVGKWDRKTIEKAPSSKTDNSGEQKAAVDIVKTLNWQKSIHKVSKRPGTATQTNKTKPPTDKPRFRCFCLRYEGSFVKNRKF